jgi:crotonobetainyl-CoA:carnitine CoA-transferase CaiB-like acyl-CoA transferase
MPVGAEGAPARVGSNAAEALRAEPRGIVATMLEERFGSAPIDTRLAMPYDAGVPSARAVRPADLFTDPQMLANDLIAKHQHAGWGPVRQSGVLAKFERTPSIAWRAAPLLGQHSREVLREVGCVDAPIDALIAGGVIVEAS